MVQLAHRYVLRVGSLVFEQGLLCSSMSWDFLFPSAFARKGALCWPAQEVPFVFFLDPANSHTLWTGQSGTRTSLQWVPHETPPPQWTEWTSKEVEPLLLLPKWRVVSLGVQKTTLSSGPKLLLSSMTSEKCIIFPDGSWHVKNIRNYNPSKGTRSTVQWCFRTWGSHVAFISVFCPALSTSS